MPHEPFSDSLVVSFKMMMSSPLLKPKTLASIALLFVSSFSPQLNASLLQLLPSFPRHTQPLHPREFTGDVSAPIPTDQIPSTQLSSLTAGLTLAQAPSPVALTPLLTAPDWNQITFSNLPGFGQPGGFTVPPEVTALLGFDPSRQWSGAEPLADVLQLGDFQGSFELQQLTLDDISAIIGLDLAALRLNDLELLGRQTLSDLAAAVPSLGSVNLSSLPIVRDVLSAAGVNVNNRTTLNQLLQEPAIAALPLSQVDLSAYDLTALPGLTTTPLANFHDWQQTPVSGVPGLARVPFARFSGSSALQQATPALADIVFSNAEGNVNRPVSGSYQEGFAVPCQQNCAHIELGFPYEGEQWISGLSQQVRGGYGFLGQVNNGLEPTGRHPFGLGFKVAVLETNEATGTATTGLYFRFCVKRTFVDLGCTPYFIGPVPWLPVQEESLTFL